MSRPIPLIAATLLTILADVPTAYGQTTHHPAAAARPRFGFTQPLPRTARLPTLEPPRQRAVSPDEPQEARDVLFFAGETVELRPLPGWQVREVPYGREVRLVISPSAPAGQHGMPVDGVWLTFHVGRPSQQDLAEELAQGLARRLPLAASNPALGKVHRLTVGDWRGLLQEFTANQVSTGVNSPPVDVRGFHLLVRCNAGLFELHGVAPVAVYEQRLAEFKQLVASVNLHEPKIDRPMSLTEDVRAAEQLLGSWKSYRGRLRLAGDGRVVIAFDPPTNEPLDEPRRNSPTANQPPIRGTYTAADDLLYVTWTDGSRLNFRWRLQGESLLLTDNTGQTSLLKRIIE